MDEIKTDVLIVGSGFGAAAPALRLTSAGLNVLMIEKGKHIDPDKDFKMTQDPKYLLQYLKGAESDAISFTYAEALGGGSGFYEMVSLRAPSKVFSLKDERDRFYWPGGINRLTLDPFYDIAEEMLHVEQITADDIPKSGIVFSNLMKNLGYSCDRARYAVKGCVGSGYCISGCVFGAKQSLLLTYLPQARKNGLKVMTDMEAIEIFSLLSNRNSTRNLKSIATTPERYEIICRNTKNNEKIRIKTKLLILGGGTIGTARLLLDSKKNLYFLSGHIGKNIAFNGSIKAVGLLPEGSIEGDMFSGRSHPGMISYQFFESKGITISTAKPLPLYVVVTAQLFLEGEKRMPVYWGEANVDLMKQYRKKMIVLYSLGLTPPCAELKRGSSGKLSPSLEMNDQLKKYYKDTQSLLNSILKRNGCKIINHKMVNSEGAPHNDIFYSTAHMVGSCRMAESKKHGVVNSFCEVFDYPGIYVTDGAAIPTSLAVNTSLTILANAERISRHLIGNYKIS